MIRLALGPATPTDQLSLSGIAAVGEHLFLAPDEGTHLLRLTKRDRHEYDRPTASPLEDLLRLPGTAGGEVDLEGLSFADGYLWCVGSHSAVRKRVKPDALPDKVARDLLTVTFPAERRVLARIPVTADGSLVRAAPPDGAGPARTAACLRDAPGQGLRDVLAEDPYVGPFAGLPGKDNGLDVEGLVALDARILVGLRGPVLRGWAVVVELAPVVDPADPEHLVLGPVTAGAVHELHFLDLAGLGVRDLARDGDDLLVLAGPTMVLDGPSRVLRIPRGAAGLPRAVHRTAMTQVGPDLPPAPDAGHRPPAAVDHPEAIALLERRDELVVVYDSPGKDRVHDGVVVADTLDL